MIPFSPGYSLIDCDKPPYYSSAPDINMPAEADHATLPSYEPHVPDQYADIIKAKIEASSPVVRKHHAPIFHCSSESL